MGCFFSKSKKSDGDKTKDNKVSENLAPIFTTTYVASDFKLNILTPQDIPAPNIQLILTDLQKYIRENFAQLYIDEMAVFKNKALIKVAKEYRKHIAIWYENKWLSEITFYKEHVNSKKFEAFYFQLKQELHSLRIENEPVMLPALLHKRFSCFPSLAAQSIYKSTREVKYSDCIGKLPVNLIR